MSRAHGVAVADSLAPVREALLASAHAQAAALLAEADAAAAAAVDRAEAEASALRRQARTQGEADAARELVDERARARRRARTVLLTVQNDAYEELRRRTRHALAELTAGPAHAAVQEALAARARAALGPGATVQGHPGGGVEAQAGERRMVLGVADLADLAVDRLGPELEDLWSP